MAHDYSQLWSQTTDRAADTRTILQWGPEGVEVTGRAEKRLHIMLLSDVLSSLRPRSVLEVGSGNGLVSMSLALMHPEIRFAGIELTSAGVKAAQTLQASADLPAEFGELIATAPQDPSAHKRVEFRTGNAASLPFEAASFDLALTSLALEQMSAVVEAALREIGARGNATCPASRAFSRLQYEPGAEVFLQG